MKNKKKLKTLNEEFSLSENKGELLGGNKSQYRGGFLFRFIDHCFCEIERVGQALSRRNGPGNGGGDW